MSPDYARMTSMTTFRVGPWIFLLGGLMLLIGALRSDAQDITRVLWQEDPLQQVKVNEDFIQRSPEHIRAILAFLSTRAGTACQQTAPHVVTIDLNDPEILDMELNDLFTPAKLTCELSKEVGYDDQCSDEHLAFVKKWFRRDTAIFKELESCARVPATASLQSALSYIEIREQNGIVDVHYAITRTDTRAGTAETKRFVDRYELEYDMLQRTAHDVE